MSSKVAQDAAQLAAAGFAASLRAERLGYPPAEFTARRAALAKSLGKGTVVLFGRTAPQAGIRFRQDNDFYYFTGNEDLKKQGRADEQAGQVKEFFEDVKGNLLLLKQMRVYGISVPASRDLAGLYPHSGVVQIACAGASRAKYPQLRDVEWIRYNHLYRNYFISGVEDAEMEDSGFRTDPGTGEYRSRYARLLASEGQLALAISAVEDGISNVPEFRQLYIEGFQYAARAGLPDTARSYIERWLKRHPDDGEFSATLSEFDSIMEDAKAASAPSGG